MIYEFPTNWTELDPITKEVILEDYADCLREECCGEDEIKMLLEMAEFELND